jgi:chromosomal replication initiation ATPase DnaA
MRPIGDARQLVLDLPHVAATGLEDFLPAPSNRAALDAVLAWPAWPSTALILDGPEGAGKTHLARIWQRRAEAVYLAAAEMWEPADPFERLGPAGACVVDDADRVLDGRLLLHLYNVVAERRGGLLLTAARPLAAWEIGLPDLRSRLRTAWCVTIGAPGADLLSAVLVKQLGDRQLRVEPGVVELLAARMERSFAAAAALVRRLDALSLRAGRPIGMALARAALAQLALERAADGHAERDEQGPRR